MSLCKLKVVNMRNRSIQNSQFKRITYIIISWYSEHMRFGLAGKINLVCSIDATTVGSTESHAERGVDRSRVMIFSRKERIYATMEYSCML